MRRAFTLIEVLVVIGLIALLLGILIPVLASAREKARSAVCAANLGQIGVGLTMYIGEHRERLPQVRVNDFGQIVEAPDGDNIGALFGGKHGTLPVFGIDSIGADKRPLNAYLGDYDPGEEVEAFSDPSDKGTDDPSLAYLEQLLGAEIDSSNMYNLVGNSYNLNDHALDNDPSAEIYPTLIPEDGGPMPWVVNPSRTWLVGDQPIYNFDDGGDRGQRWHNGRVVTSLLFVDMHVRMDIPVPEGTDHTTPDYTYLPSPDWLERFQTPGNQP
ncbi:MAG: DUF1559 domain-containing protein [Planctomycetota bacterium]|nr:DUF1559 domain-containing protein [Planctomycetota bacterium]